jgi:iron-sulfur cluster repair protein YtfE (RIC family)
MTETAAGAPNPRGEALVEELRWVHGIIRENLTTVSELVDKINDGIPSDQIHAEIDNLARASALWTLRINCLRYCSLVHHHHKLEDAALFPGLRRANPELCPVIDKLESDHIVVAELLDEIEAAAARILNDDTARVELAGALKRLGEHLLAHLDYEETNISPTLRRLAAWPLG